MSNTTADCKNFIVEFVKANPSVILSIYGPDLPKNDQIALIAEATTTKLWKRTRKFNIKNCDYDEFQIHNVNVPIKRCQYDGTTTVKANQFVIGREFCLHPDEYENAIQFIILEKSDGTLVFGPYSGD